MWDLGQSKILKTRKYIFFYYIIISRNNRVIINSEIIGKIINIFQFLDRPRIHISYTSYQFFLKLGHIDRFNYPVKNLTD